MNLAFLKLNPFQEGYMGDVLVTDSIGKPLEFCCTSVIKPVGLQPALYGKSLLPHISVEVAGKPLIKEIKNNPEVVLVDDEYFLELRKDSKAPLIHLRRQGENALTSENGISNNNSQLLSCKSGKYQTVVLTSHRKYPEDAKNAMTLLDETFLQLDLLEPFERIKQALVSVYEHQRHA